MTKSPATMPAPKAMSKSELVAEIAKQTGLSLKQSKELVESIFATITKGLKKQGKVSISGFGNFELKKRPKRKGRNPATGAEITIPAKTVLKFRPLKGLKDAVLPAGKK